MSQAVNCPFFIHIDELVRLEVPSLSLEPNKHPKQELCINTDLISDKIQILLSKVLMDMELSISYII